MYYPDITASSTVVVVDQSHGMVEAKENGRRHVKKMNATVDFYLIINTGRRNLDTTRDDTRTHMHTNETLCDSKTVAADVY